MEKMTVEEALTLLDKKIKITARSFLKNCPASVGFDDLVQEGRMALVSAHGKYDPNKGAQFWTYAERKVRGAMQDYINSQAMYFNRKEKVFISPTPTDPYDMSDYPDPKTEFSNNDMDAFGKVLLIKDALKNMTDRQKKIFVDLFVYGRNVRQIMHKHRISHNKFKDEFTRIVNVIKPLFED